MCSAPTQSRLWQGATRTWFDLDVGAARAGGPFGLVDDDDDYVDDDDDGSDDDDGDGDGDDDDDGDGDYDDGRWHAADTADTMGLGGLLTCG